MRGGPGRDRRRRTGVRQRGPRARAVGLDVHGHGPCDPARHRCQPRAHQPRRARFPAVPARRRLEDGKECKVCIAIASKERRTTSASCSRWRWCRATSASAGRSVLRETTSVDEVLELLEAAGRRRRLTHPLDAVSSRIGAKPVVRTSWRRAGCGDTDLRRTGHDRAGHAGGVRALGRAPLGRARPLCRTPGGAVRSRRRGAGGPHPGLAALVDVRRASRHPRRVADRDPGRPLSAAHRTRSRPSLLWSSSWSTACTGARDARHRPRARARPS